MPALMPTTYQGLQDAIALELNREDLTMAGHIPGLIFLCEAAINRDFRWRKLLVRDVIVPPSTDEPYENLPSDFLQLRSIRFNTDPVVEPEYVTPNYMEVLRASFRGASGTPRYYTIVGTQILFERVATGSPELELMHYVKVPTIISTDPNNTNALLLEHPDIYLYGSLIHAEVYLKNDARLTTWAALYGAATSALQRTDRAAEKSPGPLLVRTSRPVFG